MKINDVECAVSYQLFNGEKIRKVTPLMVGNSPFVGFAISSFAEQFPDPHEQARRIWIWSLAYAGGCYRFLLRKRKFDLMSLSSPYYPTLRGMCRGMKIEPTGNVLLDNLQRMIRLGASGQSKRTKGMLRKAVYLHPDWIYPEDDKGKSEALMRRLEQEMRKPIWEKIKTVNDALNEPLGKTMHKVTEREFALKLFWAERMLFKVLHHGAEAVYERIKRNLCAAERTVFKQNFFKAPNYLDRIIQFDMSRLMSSYLSMLEKIERQVEVKIASRFISLERIPQIWRSYLEFYPHWYKAILTDEKVRRFRRKKQMFYTTSLDDKLREQPEYSSDAMQQMLMEPIPEDEELPGPELKKPERNIGKRRAETIRLEEKIARLAAEGILGKEIAKIIGKSPSYVSKIKKRLTKDLMTKWESFERDSLRRSLRGKIKRAYDRLEPKKKTLFRNLYVAFIKRIIEELLEVEPDLDAERLKKDLIPDFFRE